MKLGQLFIATLILLFTQLSLNAQVQFILDADPDTKTYVVSMLPEVTWEYPLNRTATAQITVKAPTGLFNLKEFTSLTSNVEWIMNARVNSPAEAPDYDYLSFSLVTTGLEPLDFVEGKPTKLFCFKNATDCSGQVSLVNNTNDPFLPPNSRSINIGNSLAVHGAKGEAYRGNVSDKAFDCDFGITELVEETATPPVRETLEAYTDIFPNPSNESVNIKFSWDKTDGEKEVLIYNNIGELVQFYKENVVNGDNHLTFDVSSLTGGIYNMMIVEKGNRIALGKVMKIQ